MSKPVPIGPRFADALAQQTREWYQRARGEPDQLPHGNPLLPQPRSITFWNDTGSEIPARAILAVTGSGVTADGERYLRVAMPSAAFSRNYAVLDNRAVPAGDLGQCFTHGRAEVLFGDASVAAGDELGPKPGNWALWKGWPGIATVLGVVDAENKIALVRLKSLDFVWCELQAELKECGQAAALVIVPDETGELCATQWSITVKDSHNAVSSSLLADGEPAAIPAGTRVFVQLESNTAGHAIAFGEGDCCAEPSSSSPSESSQSSESSESSQSSESSDSSQSSESSQSSGSPPSESQPSQSSKSEAIVPASWTRGGYAGLFIAEMPDVRFDDVMEVEVEQHNQTVPIDPRFVEVCEPGTLRVCGAACDWPVAIGAAVEGDGVALRFGSRKQGRNVRVVLRLTGIRKGFGDAKRYRFPNRTQAQFEANERFLKRMYQQANSKR